MKFYSAVRFAFCVTCLAPFGAIASNAAEVTFVLESVRLDDAGGLYRLSVDVSEGDNAGLAAYTIVLPDATTLHHFAPVANHWPDAVGMSFYAIDGIAYSKDVWGVQRTVAPDSLVYGIGQPNATPNWPDDPPPEFHTGWNDDGVLARGRYESASAVSFGTHANASVFVKHGSVETIGNVSHGPSVFPPGDVDEDGDVDEIDYLYWQGGFGCTSICDGDFDNDGDVDATDYIIWQTMYPTPAEEYDGGGLKGELVVHLVEIDFGLAGDFDEDGDVDGQDFLAWQGGGGHYGSSTHADGDADLDGDVDGDDFLIWQAQFGIGIDPGGASSVAIPEPATLLTALFALASVVCERLARTRFHRNANS